MSRYAKAVVGALVAGLSVVLTALTTGDQAISAGEWVAAAIATLTALSVVWGVPNAQVGDPTPKGRHARQAGYGLIELVVGVLIVLILVVVLLRIL